MELSLPNHYFDFLLHYFPIWVSVRFIFYVCISIMEELSRKLIGIFNCISALLLALALVFFFFFFNWERRFRSKLQNSWTFNFVWHN